MWYYNGSLSNATVESGARSGPIQTATDGGHVDMTLGHIQVLKTARTNRCTEHLNAWWNEVVGVRLARLRDENGLSYAQYVRHRRTTPRCRTRGPQPVGTVLDLFRDCETTDQGILWDGRRAGAELHHQALPEAGSDGKGTPKWCSTRRPGTWRCRSSRCTTTPIGSTGPPRRADGASAVFEDATGPLGSGIVGRYEDSREFGVLGDAALPQYAGWMVGQGTVEGYRYPRLSLDLVAHPSCSTSG